mgnify:CR=1 FL=1
MGAGIMPICIRGGTLCVLLGQERYDKKWSDFGGSRNPGESYITTALREGEEELNGILGTGRTLNELVKNNYIAEIDNGESYSSFVFRLRYDNRLPQYFNNNNLFIEKKLHSIVDGSYENHEGLFEKRRIKWFTLEDIERDYTIFRPHFVPILKTIVINKSSFRENVVELVANTHTNTRKTAVNTNGHR